MPAQKFTDQDLGFFYRHVLEHYKNCMERSLSPKDTYDEIYNAVWYALYYGELHNLEQRDKNRVLNAFNTIFYSFPANQNFFHTHQNNPIFIRHDTIKINYSYTYDCCHHSHVSDWLFFYAIASSDRGRAGRFGGGGFGRTHRHRDKKDEGNLLIALFLLFLAASAAIVATLAMYYMLNQFLTSIERFYYNEGWLKAALMLSTSFAFGAGATLLTLNFVSPLLVSLAIAAGFNPAAVVITGIVLLTVIGAAIGCLATSYIYDAIEQKKYKDAIDPLDPLRFRLTEKEEIHLMNNEIDPTAVRCALIAIREELSKQGVDKSTLSFLPRIFTASDNTKQLLTAVRQLRAGKLTTVTVGDKEFNCEQRFYYRDDQTNEVYQPFTQSPPPYSPQIIFSY